MLNCVEYQKTQMLFVTSVSPATFGNENEKRREWGEETEEKND